MKEKLTYNQIQSRRKFYKRFHISVTDLEVVTEFDNVLKRMGYPFNVRKKVKNEMIKDYSENKQAQVCKHCGQKIYKALINKPVGIVPTKPICVDCIKNSRLEMFKPKMSFEDAWDKSKLS